MNINEHLENMLEGMEEKADALDDGGHLKLVDDLEKLLEKAKRGYYHDFHRNGADASKITLVTDLDEMREKTIDGNYDNHL